MARRLLLGLLLVTGALGLLACGSSAQPTKDQLGTQLNELVAALTAGDTAKAVTHMKLPPGNTVEEAEPMLAPLLEKREISPAGVKVLLDKGTFGKLAEVFPDDGPRRAERVGVALDECYALRFERAEVMAHWTGSSFKIFRLDDVGKLAD